MAEKKQFMTCDGNCAAAHMAYMFSEVAAIFIQNCEYQNKYYYVISDIERRNMKYIL